MYLQVVSETALAMVLESVESLLSEVASVLSVSDVGVVSVGSVLSESVVSDEDTLESVLESVVIAELSLVTSVSLVDSSVLDAAEAFSVLDAAEAFSVLDSAEAFSVDCSVVCSVACSVV